MKLNENKKKNKNLPALLFLLIFLIVLFGTLIFISATIDKKNVAEPEPIERRIAASEIAKEAETAIEAEAETEPPTAAPTEPPTAAPTEPPTEPPTEAQPVPVPAPQPQVIHFIVNTDSGCIHASAGCSAAQKINPEHRAEIDIPENEIPNYAGKYWACGKCSSHYSAQLPKP